MQFKDVLVDSKVKEQLLREIHEHRISHAQLFLAQPGSHAFALAVALAQYICCEHPTDTDSCGTCPSCVQFSKLTHPDLHIYFPNCTTKEIKKDPDSIVLAQQFKDFVFNHRYHIDIQDWLSELDGENKQAAINTRDCSHIVNQNSTRSYMGGYKIYILWNVDRLNDAAAPRLLKTLEEPENKSLFILISEKPEKILNTILSRTQLIKIPNLSEEDIMSELRLAFPSIDDETAYNTAILAEGNYNKALKIYNDDTYQKMMLDTFSIMFNSAIMLAQGQPAQAVQYENVQTAFSEIIAQGREMQKMFLEFILKMLRNIMMQNTGHTSMVKTTPAELTVMQLFNKISLKQVTQINELCNTAIYHVSRNGNASIIFTDLYFKIAGTLK